MKLFIGTIAAVATVGVGGEIGQCYGSPTTCRDYSPAPHTQPIGGTGYAQAACGGSCPADTHQEWCNDNPCAAGGGSGCWYCILWSAAENSTVIDVPKQIASEVPAVVVSLDVAEAPDVEEAGQCYGSPTTCRDYSPAPHTQPIGGTGYAQAACGGSCPANTHQEWCNDNPCAAGGGSGCWYCILWSATENTTVADAPKQIASEAPSLVVASSIAEASDVADAGQCYGSPTTCRDYSPAPHTQPIGGTGYAQAACGGECPANTHQEWCNDNPCAAGGGSGCWYCILWSAAENTTVIDVPKQITSEPSAAVVSSSVAEVSDVEEAGQCYGSPTTCRDYSPAPHTQPIGGTGYAQAACGGECPANTHREWCNDNPCAAGGGSGCWYCILWSATENKTSLFVV